MKLQLPAIILALVTAAAAGNGYFYREYWADFDKAVSNHADGRWRVNDPELSLHPVFGKRPEARANGLMLIDLDQDLFALDGVCLYLEMWGGHPDTADKRFFVNGRGPYPIDSFGTESNHCTYSYPLVELNTSHLVRGINAFQFACERGDGFWGHFIIDNAALRCRLAPDHPDIASCGLDYFAPKVRLSTPVDAVADQTQLWLDGLPAAATDIVRVDYFARYEGFDDNGDLIENDWHGFTHRKKPVNHICTSTASPYRVAWDTSLIPSQKTSMAVKAVVTMQNGLLYETEITDRLSFPARRPTVSMFKCDPLPAPFWSRASREKTALITLPADLSGAVRARLQVKVWDGGQGKTARPFTINGRPYNILSGRAVHDVVYTDIEIALSDLLPGPNTLKLLSDTDHHGIEILLPGPCLTLRFNKD